MRAFCLRAEGESQVTFRGVRGRVLREKFGWSLRREARAQNGFVVEFRGF